MRLLYLILAILLLALVVTVAQADTIYPNPQMEVRAYLPIVHCRNYCIVFCPAEEWPKCDCPWCLPGEEYCRDWPWPDVVNDWDALRLSIAPEQ